MQYPSLWSWKLLFGIKNCFFKFHFQVTQASENRTDENKVIMHSFSLTLLNNHSKLDPLYCSTEKQSKVSEKPLFKGLHISICFSAKTEGGINLQFPSFFLSVRREASSYLHQDASLLQINKFHYCKNCG